jgi:hypothetical protein
MEAKSIDNGIMQWPSLSICVASGFFREVLSSTVQDSDVLGEETTQCPFFVVPCCCPFWRS